MSISTMLRGAVRLRRYGALEEVRGSRPLPDFERLNLASAPSSDDLDLDRFVPAECPLSQGPSGACVSFSWAEAEMITMRARYDIASPCPSLRAGYYWGREWGGVERSDRGCIPSNLYAAVAKHGLPTEAAFPWSIKRLNQRPPMSVRWDAQNRVGVRDSYCVYYPRFEDRVKALRAALASRRAFSFTIPVTEHFDKCRSNTLVKWDPKAKVRGYHQLTGLGCTTDGVIHALNHWGPGHGVNGRVRLEPGFLGTNWFHLVIVDPRSSVQ